MPILPFSSSHARIKDAISRYASGRMDFIDAYNIAYIKAKDLQKVATFDVKQFKGIDGVASIW